MSKDLFAMRLCECKSEKQTLSKDLMIQICDKRHQEDTDRKGNKKKQLNAFCKDDPVV